jgi:hypothetical protein
MVRSKTRTSTCTRCSAARERKAYDWRREQQRKPGSNSAQRLLNGAGRSQDTFRFGGGSRGFES